MGLGEYNTPTHTLRKILGCGCARVDIKLTPTSTHPHPGTKMVNVVFQEINLKNMITNNPLFKPDRSK